MSLVRLKLLLVGLVIGLAILGHGAQAQQAALIGILDDQAIFQQTKAGKQFQDQVKRQRAAFQNDVQAQENALRNAAQQLQAQAQSLTPEALQKKRQDLDKQANDARASLAKKQDAMNRSLANAEQQIRNTVFAVAADIAQGRGLTLVLLRSQVVFFNPAYDITKEAVTRFDQKLPALSFK